MPKTTEQLTAKEQINTYYTSLGRREQIVVVMSLILPIAFVVGWLRWDGSWAEYIFYLLPWLETLLQ